MMSLQLISVTSTLPGTVILGCQHLRSAATGTLLVPCARTATGQQSFTVSGPATSTTVTGLVRERLQAGTEDAPVLDRPAPLRRLHDWRGI